MKRAEVWLVQFVPQIGQEIGKIRPAVIVSHDAIGALSLKVVVPVSESQSVVRDWHVSLRPTKQNGLMKSSVADCFQVKSLSTGRFVRRLGELSPKDMDNIKYCLAKVLDLI